ncbi:MAG TPA: substrate-binding domain-containing protein [Candidatus Acidoferrum sp.]|nr:substrate-binding domain-containing protein [Candidatus Acidoferrum sp.]
MLRRHLLGWLVAILGLSAVAALPAAADERFIVVASTTSTQDSGLFDYLLPLFTQKTGIQVRVLYKGTGEAIKVAQNGDADVLFVHDKKSEEKFVADGFGVKRSDVMYNDFVIVGPGADPAGIKGTADVVGALKKIAAAKAPFASRGDDSGTNKAELRLWKAAEIDPKKDSGTWYRETGSGMGPTLNTAAGMGAYALTDRGTWLNFKNRGDLEILVEGDKRLFNQYGVTLVNPEKFPHVKKADAQAFIDWVLSPEGQQAIANYKIGGQQVFYPNYQPTS